MSKWAGTEARPLETNILSKGLVCCVHGAGRSPAGLKLCREQNNVLGLEQLVSDPPASLLETPHLSGFRLSPEPARPCGPLSASPGVSRSPFHPTRFPRVPVQGGASFGSSAVQYKLASSYHYMHSTHTHTRRCKRLRKNTGSAPCWSLISSSR